MSDVRAAAERLSDRDLSEYQGPTGDDADIRAGVALAREWLREHPADEDEAVTEEWLRSAGFSRDDHPHKWTVNRDDALPIGLWHVDDGWKAVLILSEWSSANLVRMVNTRGDVRRLCAALGIKLTEAKGEGT